MYSDNLNRRGRAGMALLLAGLVGASGCSDTALQGVTLDDALDTPELVFSIIKGGNSEVADIWYVGGEGGMPFDMAGATDEFVYDGFEGYATEVATNDFRDRQISMIHDQANEGSWAAIKGIQRAQAVFSEQEFQVTPVVARSWVNMGNSEVALGQNYCETVYAYGPEGGFALQGPNPYDGTQIVQRDSSFNRALFGYLAGIEQAERAIAAGESAPNGDPLFDPEYLLNEANAGAAYSYMALASLGIDEAANWQRAADHASQVPTDFEAIIAIQNSGAGGAFNDWYNEMHNDDNASVWGQDLGNGVVWGSPATYLYEGDPRLGGDFVKCQQMIDPSQPIGPGPNEAQFEDGPDADSFDECFGGIGTEEDNVPRWLDRKFLSLDDDFVIYTGREMRLIQAEAAIALNGAGGLGEFTTQVNAVRNFHGLTPISQPATVGEFEYPNAQDDAMSILDRERFLTGWGSAKRFFDLDRWNHPFFEDDIGLTPFHQEIINSQGGRLFTCLPIPQIECNLNPDLNCPVLN